MTRTRVSFTIVALVAFSFALVTPFAAQEKREVHESFESVSIKPATLLKIPSGLDGKKGPFGPCIGLPELVQGRLRMRNVTVYSLIARAYEMGPCMFVLNSGRIDGPEWIMSDQLTIEAKIPEGSDRYSVDQVRTGNASQLQQMIKSLLADRFKLVLHREMRDIPVYSLTVAHGGAKLQPSQDEGCVDLSSGGLPIAGRSTCGTRVLRAIGPNLILDTSRLTIADFAEILGLNLDRPIQDNTGLAGLFDIHFVFARDAATSALPAGGVLIMGGPSLSGGPDKPLEQAPPASIAIQEQLGLNLEAAKGPVEVLVIDSVNKPSVNYLLTKICGWFPARVMRREYGRARLQPL